jgi:hypothetical protein
VLPLATSEAYIGELAAYLDSLGDEVEVIVADGSPPAVFSTHGAQLPASVFHLPVPAYMATPMGKVGGVLTGLQQASHERVIIADDDVRYDPESLRAVVAHLDHATVVRPQNYFQPLPWHAAWDTGRSLVNRAIDGDWPGTLAVRRSAVMDAGGYAGDALFENLELVRTLTARGGTEVVAREVLVARRPPTTPHFWSQRVRQAYDEFARPPRLLASLALLPALLLVARRRPAGLVLAAGAVVAVAEVGRRRDGGGRVFPAWTPLMAPLWLLERAVCAWLAVASRALFGGIRYRGGVLRRAATSTAELRRA